MHFIRLELHFADELIVNTRREYVFRNVSWRVYKTEAPFTAGRGKASVEHSKATPCGEACCP